MQGQTWKEIMVVLGFFTSRRVPSKENIVVCLTIHAYIKNQNAGDQH